VVGGGRVRRTWAGSQWDMLLKTMSGADCVGQMGRQLPQCAHLAKGSRPGGVVRIGGE
jgi:hypothetical protein